MDKFIGVSFQTFRTLILSLGRAAKDAFAVFPGVPDIFVADIAGDIVKMADGERAIWVFGAIERPAR